MGIAGGQEQGEALQSFLANIWQAGSGPGQALIDPTTGNPVAYASSTGLDLAAALAFARANGGPALRQMTFAERAAMLGKIADALQVQRDRWYEISRLNSGNTRADAAIDVDGAIGTLKYFAKLGSELGDATLLADGPSQRLGRDPNFQGRHIGVPIRGVAVHINAFNFPAWGLWGKAAVALLSGVPVLAKPATSTAWLAEEMVRAVIEAEIVPPGALSLLCGSPEGLLGALSWGDAVAFTGSADTAHRIQRTLEGRNVRLNVEADSLNSALLAPDAGPGSLAFELLAAEVVKEMTSKAGQKCTAIRRVLIQQDQLDTMASTLVDQLTGITIGDPDNPQVQMGPVVNMSQREAAEKGIAALAASAEILTKRAPTLQNADWDRGAFVAPTLLRQEGPSRTVHEIEVFGPVATLIPYRSAEDAFDLIRSGGGSLACSVYSEDATFLATAAAELSSAHGRLLLVDPAIGASHSGHGIVLPSCLHGGPGRAGDGAELGGLRGLWFYHQKTAIQASGETLAAFGRLLGPQN